MKLPSSVGQKKTKAIEHLLDELGIPIQPMPTDEICQLYNDLRSDNQEGPFCYPTILFTGIEQNVLLLALLLDP